VNIADDAVISGETWKQLLWWLFSVTVRYWYDLMMFRESIYYYSKYYKTPIWQTTDAFWWYDGKCKRYFDADEQTKPDDAWKSMTTLTMLWRYDDWQWCDTVSVLTNSDTGENSMIWYDGKIMMKLWPGVMAMMTAGDDDIDTWRLTDWWPNGNRRWRLWWATDNDDMTWWSEMVMQTEGWPVIWAVWYNTTD